MPLKFKAFVFDGNKLMSKILLAAIKGVEIIVGDGGVGSIKLMGGTSQLKSMKHRVNELDKENFTFNNITNIKIVPSAEGGYFFAEIEAYIILKATLKSLKRK
ncbi:hypothetical protein RJ640_001054 [Escallonia rubra]|uniref:Uncharacterized protein n=1 Tax=Escallonia rubra TaxID=112253 RepID=A0AA88UWC1_9ASTE|nr:hypothetical protein RJ640_001054 [Escallonia rubra]